MAKKPTTGNGHSRLEEAMTLLVQTQATLLARVAETDRAHVEFQRQHLAFEREAVERFVRIEAQMAEIIHVLNDHGRLLQEHGRLIERLTEAVREKIGIKGQA